MSEPKKRKILSPFEWGVFFIAIGILAYVLIGSNEGGFSVMEQTENIEIKDNPHASKGAQKTRRYNETQEEESVEAVLKQLATQFSKEKSPQEPEISSSAMSIKKQKSISKEEMKYYEGLKQSEKISDKIRNAGDWFKTLKSAHDTYQKIESVFSEASGQAPKELNEEDLKNALDNAKSAQNIYTNLREMFNISEEQSREFAQRGKKTLSDWAQFIEENQK